MKNNVQNEKHAQKIVFKRKCIKPQNKWGTQKKREKYLAGSSNNWVVLTSSFVNTRLRNNPLNNIGFIRFHLFVHVFKV